MLVFAILVILSIPFSTSFLFSCAKRQSSSCVWENLQFDKDQIDDFKSHEFKFTVFGEPMPLSRHRYHKGIMYNPSAKFQRQFLRDSLPYLPLEPLSGAIEMELAFFFQRPLSHFRSGRYSHLLKPTAPRYHSSRKDLDNLVKFVMDALNAKAYKDDGQVCSLRCSKAYINPGERARVNVVLRQLPDDTVSLASTAAL